MLRKSTPNLTRKTGAAAPALEHTGFLQNQMLFADFYSTQTEFVVCVARHPELVRMWLDSLPLRDDTNEGPPTASQAWRTSRLSATRQRELSALVVETELTPTVPEPLIAFLLKALPVMTYFLIADGARPSLQAIDPPAADLYRRLLHQRDHIFNANYGLARRAVAGRKPYDELLSAASCGLVDAIDRYVPTGKNSARFSYFASFWIRYQVSRYGQKNLGTVALSINQQRIIRRIERYLEERRRAGLPPSSEVELCTDLKISSEAYYWYSQRPVMVSLDSVCPSEDDRGEQTPDVENLIASPEPGPDEQLEDTEIAEYLRELLRENLSGQHRVMLSYARRVGNLADAVEDYLADLETQALEHVRPLSAVTQTSGTSPGQLVYIDDAKKS